MGVDYIREHSGKPWRKRWDKGLDRLKAPGLFDVRFSDRQRTVSADITGEATLKLGDQLILQGDGASAIVCQGQYKIGELEGIPADISAALASCGGIALGTVERVGLFGNRVELSIR